MQDVLDAIKFVQFSEASDWHAYKCDNEVQSIVRLSSDYLTNSEIQINSITHSAGIHSHGCDMVSIMLDGGYTYSIMQEGAINFLEQYAAPGSVLRMGPNDIHMIPQYKGTQSLSLCVFSKRTDWHLHYPAIDSSAKNILLENAKRAIHNSRTWSFLYR